MVVDLISRWSLPLLLALLPVAHPLSLQPLSMARLATARPATAAAATPLVCRTPMMTAADERYIDITDILRMSEGELEAVAGSFGGITMQEDGGDGGGQRERERQTGRSATIAKPKPKAKPKNREEVDNEPMWRVLLHNDDVHTWDYVIFAITSVVKTVTKKKAHKITTTVHTQGTATVTVTWKQLAKQYCLKLQGFGLTSSISPDK